MASARSLVLGPDFGGVDPFLYARRLSMASARSFVHARIFGGVDPFPTALTGGSMVGMSETSHEDQHNEDVRLSPKTPDEHSGNQDVQALSHRRQEAEEKLQQRQEEVDGDEESDRGDGSGRGEESDGED